MPIGGVTIKSMSPKGHKGRLRNKIFFFMLAVGVVPLLIAAVLTEYAVSNAHRSDVAKLEAVVLAQASAQVQGFIDGDILAQTHVVIPFGPGIDIETGAQQYLLQQTIASRPWLISESFVNLAGHETARVDQNTLQGYPTSTLRDVSNSPGFAAAKAGNYYIGPVSYPSSTPQLDFASPVKNSTGDTIAVIMGTASLADLQGVIASSTIGSTGYVYLVDGTGKMIADGGPVAGGGAYANMIGASDVANLDIVQKVVAGENLTTDATQARYKSIFGGSVVAAAMPIAEYGPTWGLVAEWPTAEADAVINALLIRDLIALIIVLVLVILISIFLSSLIVRPIKKLEEGTARVAQGKFDEGVSIATHDELEDLGESFNTMVLGLKELEQLKDEFVFIAAHELRTPVAAMKGYLQLILEGTTGAISDGTRTFIEKVIASNQRLIQLVNDLLEVARSQAGRLTIQVAPIDLAAPIAASLDELKSLADEKSVTMVYQPPADLPHVLADTDRVKEVVVNLVGNAIKYMGGAGSIAVSHEVVDGHVLTHIADTGLGISKDAQGQLFQKFYRVQTDKTKEITGTGLGLFIVKEIIEKMNGTIWVTSEEGRGSVFSFSLPVVS